MFNRRDFIKLGCSGIAGLVIDPLGSDRAAAAETSEYPVVDIAPLSSIKPGAVINLSYPDAGSPAMLLRLRESATEGVGPNREIVAYSALCTHKGCPVSYRAERRLIICPCHWSTFDPVKAGTLVIGQASSALPRIKLRVVGGMVQAVGVSGLIYGRHTNVL